MDVETQDTPATVMQPQRARRRVIHVARWLVALAVVLALGGLLATRVRSANQAIAAHPGLAAIAVRAGEAAPDFTFTPLNRSPTKALSLSGLRGHVVVVNFWSPTCAPCRDEAPVLAQAASQFAGSGVVFLGVAFDGARGDILSYLRQYQIAYAVGLDSAKDIAVAYGLLAIPVTVVVDGRGVIARVIQGAVTSSSLSHALRAAMG